MSRLGTWWARFPVLLNDSSIVVLMTVNALLSFVRVFSAQRPAIGGSLLMATMFCGCTGTGGSGPLDDLLVWSPWEKDDPADLARYGPVPAQEAEAIEKLASVAESASAASRTEVARELSARLPSERDPILRRRIVEALAKIPDPAAMSGLRSALTDDDLHVRLAAIDAFGRRGDADSFHLLSAALTSDKHEDVRLAAARELGRLKDPQLKQAAVAPLAEALATNDPALKNRLVQSLESVSGRRYGNDANAWRRFAQGEAVPERERSLAERYWPWF